jgi:acylphosphatase
MAMHLRITGTVQGVGYRYAFEREAQLLKLCGWIRNRLDGSVEAMVQGNPAAIEKIVVWARRGPASAQVRDVAITDADDTSMQINRFDILPTA